MKLPKKVGDIKTVEALMNILEDLDQSNKELEAYKTNLEKLVKERTEQFKESESKFQTVFDQAQDGFIILDKKGFIVDINKSALKALKLTKKKAIGVDALKFHTKDFHAKCTKNIGKALKGKMAACNCPYISLGKKLVTAFSLLSPIKIDGVPHVFISFRYTVSQEDSTKALENYQKRSK